VCYTKDSKGGVHILSLCTSAGSLKLSNLYSHHHNSLPPSLINLTNYSFVTLLLIFVGSVAYAFPYIVVKSALNVSYTSGRQ
jgi:hypothetical protein